MTPLFLARPALLYKNSYLAYQRELEATSIKPDWKIEMMNAHFDEYLEVIQARETDPMPGFVPQTDFWSVLADEVIGRVSIRHQLTPALRLHGGHIGYDVRPSYRRQGYGTRQCQLAIQEAWRMGLGDLLITCDDDNLGSIKIIEACGGVLADKIDNGLSVLTRRYWVRK